MDRRRFLTAVALGAAAAPIVSLTGRARRAPESAASLCYSNKRVLSPSDLKFLGSLRVGEGANMAFSTGTLTGRRVGDSVRLIMSGNAVQNDPVYEFEDPGGYQMDPIAAPRTPLVRTWGDIYGTSRRTWTSDGTAKVDFPRRAAGLLWNESTKLLYWTYYDTYNVTGQHDWCLGASALGDGGPVAYGPWRPSGEGKKGPWRCLHMSTHPSGRLLCGSTIMSGAIGSPWGPDLWSAAFPTPATPSGVGAADIPLTKYLTYYPMYGLVNSDGTFSGPLKACRRAGDYRFEAFPDSPGYSQIDPTKNGGVGSWTELDRVAGQVWIDLPDVHGMLFSGRLAAGHVWYRNAGTQVCSHGVASPIDVTGPVSTAAYPSFWIYDPVDLEAVRTGARTDYTVNPAHAINAEAAYGLRTAGIDDLGSAKSLCGMHFDAASRRLYVAAPDADRTVPGLGSPLIHVFQVG